MQQGTDSQDMPGLDERDISGDMILISSIPHFSSNQAAEDQDYQLVFETGGGSVPRKVKGLKL